ncbi:voltage-dependent calcium channel beta subunit-associated regulatory protein [Polypterus senegalus]|uniref:voltage-dependent calcium channel beta subunit-associated regulatory protein n=1 Tax=Polypterus senegalus TaxID=55291 RepID=UPI0019631EA8|nr:voltage-dependent calcium channel beta subunit-associated regulatory protein [Polypterus senegalus]XP_039622593.1 voltage-dependent calcium channel beta subunit-associated regulatory protein [Polypterus senegalus]
MSNELPIWQYLTENSTDVPKDPGKQDGYILLLVLLSIFIGGTLVLLSGLLVICRRCCEWDRRYSRASDDPEKTNTTYLEDSQPVQEVTIKVDDSDCLSSSSSYHNVENEHFLSAYSTGRRVSFNEASLFDHSKKAQEKGRRYTLTEGDFHHLKNARLTHFSIPPPALKIVTIHECESSENSIAMTTRPPSKSSLSIFQPLVSTLPQTALTSLSLSPSSALPGDTFNSTVDTSFKHSHVLPRSDAHDGTIKALGSSPHNGGSPNYAEEGLSTMSGPSSPSSTSTTPGTVLQFFTKLRRHASLESASPYFKIKKWKFESNQRASSLDMRGSLKRRQFQRQRAASESMDQEEHASHHLDIIQYIARTEDVAFRVMPPPSTTPPASLGRLESAEVVGAVGGLSLPLEDDETSCRSATSEQHNTYRDIWNLRASLELYASSDQSSNNDRDSVRSDGESVCSLGGGLPRHPSQDIGDDLESECEKLEFFGRDSVTGNAKQDSVDSERSSDGDAGNRKLLQMDSGYASIEAPSRAPEELRLFSTGSKDKTASEKRRYFTSSGRKGTVCESFDESVFDEELEEATGSTLEGEGPLVWSPYGQMFPTRDHHHPPHLHRRDYSIDEKTDALFHEFLRHDPQFDHLESPMRTKHRSRVHLRKQWQRTKQYSDPGVLFPPSFERQRTPLRRGDSVNYPLDTRYHSTLPRIVSTADEEVGDSPGTKTPTGAAHEEQPLSTSNGRTITEEQDPDSVLRLNPLPVLEDSRPAPIGTGNHGGNLISETSDNSSVPLPLSQLQDMGYGPQTISADLTDKLMVNLEERLYSSLRQSKEPPESVVSVGHTSPDHSPV